MKIKEYKIHFIQTLTSIYGKDEAESFFYLILGEKQKLSRVDLALSPNLIFSNEEIENWDSILEQLKLEIPIQYLLGKTNFYGLDFEVNSDVLIPRPETEELVEWIIKENSKDEFSREGGKVLKILDIGTGSGCIAISLSKNLFNAKVFAMDVSVKALEMANKNAINHTAEITFIAQNVLEMKDFGQEFDVVVSNPPYVRNLEKQEIKKNVINNEPHLALFVEDTDALVFYKKIAELVQGNYIKFGAQKNIQLYFEINQYLGKETVELLQKMNFKNIELRKDIYGNDRMIKANL